MPSTTINCFITRTHRRSPLSPGTIFLLQKGRRTSTAKDLKIEVQKVKTTLPGAPLESEPKHRNWLHQLPVTYVIVPQLTLWRRLVYLWNIFRKRFIIIIGCNNCSEAYCISGIDPIYPKKWTTSSGTLSSLSHSSS